MKNKILVNITCSSCGKKHTEWPALAYDAPFHYNELAGEEKDTIAELTTDFCVIKHPDQTDFFIRGTLIQKVIDHCEDLHYGLWVSLSEKSFKDYKENFKNDHEAEYFGWLCNDIPQYVFNESIPTTVVTQPGGNRPEIFPHQDFDHPFVKDYYNGITKAEAERRIEAMIKAVRKTKPWWKVWL
jgi:hypothetical protein